jgi:YD repeat-containing protein
MPSAAFAQSLSSCTGVGVVDPTSGNALVNPVNGSISCVAITSPDGSTIIGTMTLDGRVNESANLGSLSSTTSYTYDVGTDRLTMDANGTITTTTSYDSLNRIATSSDGTMTTYTYSGTGGEPGQVDQNGTVTRYDYNGQGQIVDTTDSMGHIQTRFQYDAEGRLSEVTDANGVALYNYTYDPQGRLSTVENDKTDDVTTYTYDTSILSRVDTDSDVTSLDKFGTTQYMYDAIDRMTTIDDPNGVTTTTTYDALDRVISSNDATNGPDYVFSVTVPEPGSVLLLGAGLGLMGLFGVRSRRRNA